MLKAATYFFFLYTLFYGGTSFAGESSGAPSAAKGPLFAGDITSKYVDEFIAKYDSEPITEITIFSAGGNMLAGLKFATWIRSKNLDVRVKTLCMSSCANFVFVSGNKKFIERGALVIWHGSIYQKDVRELMVKYERLSLIRDSGGDLGSDDAEFLLSNKVRVEEARKIKGLQDELYSALGINEYITRLGQEPVKYKTDGWTATVELMNRMGIKNVQAPSDYGAVSYVRVNPLFGIISKGVPNVFGLAPDGEIVHLSGD